MTQLTVIANITAKADKIEYVKAELLKLIDATRKEEGCIDYDLHQDNANPAHFLFYENWASRELWQAHIKSAHVTEYAKATDGAIESFTLNEMSVVS